MRKLVLLLFSVALVFAGLALGKTSHPALTGACANANLKLLHPGQLTLGTDNPAYPPWWGGKEKKSTGFQTSNPYSGKGYESAVAYEVARRLGFSRAEVKWVAVHFLNSFTPGKKPFDFYLAQVSYSPVRTKAVTFSTSYYELQQAVVGLKKNAISKVKTLAGLKPFKLGTQISTTSYAYIGKYIKPDKQPAAYHSLNDAVTALKVGQIDGLVVDFPDTGYITGVQVSNSVVVGRLPTLGGQQHFGLVLAKGNPLVTCLNKALAAMRADGTLKRLQAKWLAGTAPLLK
jgi:polar amino acid transport system substrate-binding protein